MAPRQPGSVALIAARLLGHEAPGLRHKGGDCRGNSTDWPSTSPRWKRSSVLITAQSSMVDSGRP